MSEMVERVAEAIDDAISAAGGWDDGCCDSLKVARAAIKAMREPTEDMVQAGYDGGGYTPNPSLIELAWPAMIDAAIGKVDA